jgi:hypothetical protein
MPRAVDAQAPCARFPAGMCNPLAEAIHLSQERLSRLRGPLLQIVHKELNLAACFGPPGDESDRTDLDQSASIGRLRTRHMQYVIFQVDAAPLDWAKAEK